jgi:hypothetical protein
MLKRLIAWFRPKLKPRVDERHVVFQQAGVVYKSWANEMQKMPSVWPWPAVLEFGLSFHPATFPDIHFGDYMQAEWFFTIEHDGKPQRLFLDVEYFSIEQLPEVLVSQLPGFDQEALQEGWRQYQKGLRNFEGEGQWLAWRKEGFVWRD